MNTREFIISGAAAVLVILAIGLFVLRGWMWPLEAQQLFYVKLKSRRSNDLVVS